MVLIDMLMLSAWFDIQRGAQVDLADGCPNDPQLLAHLVCCFLRCTALIVDAGVGHGLRVMLECLVVTRDVLLLGWPRVKGVVGARTCVVRAWSLDYHPSRFTVRLACNCSWGGPSRRCSSNCDWLLQGATGELLLLFVVLGEKHDHLWGWLADICVEFVTTGHRLHLELTHGPLFIIPRVISIIRPSYPIVIGGAHAGVITQRAWVALQRHLLNVELAKINLAFGPNQWFALFLNRICDQPATCQLLLATDILAIANVSIDRGEDLRGLVEIGLLLGLLLLEKLGVEDMCLDVAGGVDGRWNAVGGRLEDKMRSLVRWLRLLGAYLSLVADHRFVCTILIRNELSFIAWRSDHGIEGLITLVLAS